MPMELMATTLPPLTQSTPTFSSGIYYDQLTWEGIKGGHTLHMILKIHWLQVKWMAEIPHPTQGCF